MPRVDKDLTIAQLENILRARRDQLDALQRDRAKLQKQLDALDEKIRKMGGSVRGGITLNAAGRARNEQSLVGAMQAVLEKSGGKPMSVGDIVQGVMDTGYKSNSANFRGIVNQTRDHIAALELRFSVAEVDHSRDQGVSIRRLSVRIEG